LPISEKQIEYAEAVKVRLLAAGVRVELDARNETLGFKIRDAEKQKIPLSLVVGEQEAQAGTVSPRLRKSKDKIDAMTMDAIAGQLAAATAKRSMGPL
jgi:threonyl-tRNA synthetase